MIKGSTTNLHLLYCLFRNICIFNTYKSIFRYLPTINLVYSLLDSSNVIPQDERRINMNSSGTNMKGLIYFPLSWLNIGYNNGE